MYRSIEGEGGSNPQSIDMTDVAVFPCKIHTSPVSRFLPSVTVSRANSLGHASFAEIVLCDPSSFLESTLSCLTEFMIDDAPIFHFILFPLNYA